MHGHHCNRKMRLFIFFELGNSLYEVGNYFWGIDCHWARCVENLCIEERRTLEFLKYLLRASLRFPFALSLSGGRKSEKDLRLYSNHVMVEVEGKGNSTKHTICVWCSRDSGWGVFKIQQGERLHISTEFS